MSILSILALGAALSMDALAVAVASGGNIRPLRFNHALQIALAFGFFQALMPILGWAAGIGLRRYIEPWDHWIAFGLLAFIGGKMIYSSYHFPAGCKKADCIDYFNLLLLSLATSLDALAVGLSLSVLRVFILWPALIIGGVTFCFSLAGVGAGYKFGHFYEKRMELAGGIILIGIGIKIVVEHVVHHV
jgi:manganese efflux pump family protein